MPRSCTGFGISSAGRAAAKNRSRAGRRHEARGFLFFALHALRTETVTLNLASILLWGLFATGVLTLILSGSQQLGLSRMSLPFMLGSAVTARRPWTVLVGFALHLAFGCLFAVLYGLVFESWGRAVWYEGALLGLYHGLFVLVVITPMMPSVHPRMASKHHGPTPTRQLEPPGFLALNYGRATPAITLAGHVVYGALLSFYTLAP